MARPRATPDVVGHSKMSGSWRYLYRALGRQGQVIDVLMSKRRDIAAARSSSPDRSPGTGRHKRSPPTVDPRPGNRRLRSHGSCTTPASTPTTRIEAPQSAQCSAPPGARTQTRPDQQTVIARARLHPEPPTRPLRARCLFRRHLPPTQQCPPDFAAQKHLAWSPVSVQGLPSDIS